MTKAVSIVSGRANELEFDIEIKNVKDEDMQVRFAIESKDVNFSYDCTKGANSKWNVKIPALSYLKEGAYPFHIEVVADGYHFEPFKDTLNVTPEPKVGSSKVKSSKSKPVVKSIGVKTEGAEEVIDIQNDDVQPTLPASENTKSRYNEIAEKIISRHGQRKARRIESVDPEKDKAVRETIDSLQTSTKEEVQENSQLPSIPTITLKVVEDSKPAQELTEQDKKVRDIIESVKKK